MTINTLVDSLTIGKDLIIKPILLDQCDDVVSWNETNALITAIKDREPMMVTIGQCLFDVCNAVDTVECDNIPCHHILSNDLFAGSWNLINENRHLFSSASSLVKRSGKQCSNLVRHNDGEDDRDKERKRLRCLHHDHS